MPLIYAYLGLAASAFTSATILPGTSEAAFAAFIYTYPEQAYGAWLCAGLANGLGSMVSYWMGRLIPSKKRSSERSSEKTLRLLRRWGTLPLLFAWLPVIGDALPIAAGWLRRNPYTSGLMHLTRKIRHHPRRHQRHDVNHLRKTCRIHFQTT